MVYNNVFELVGNTPLIKLEGLAKKYNLSGDIYGKLEYMNPTGSVKDRIAKQMILDAEKNGELTSNSVIIEPTSGNTGIGLACFGIKKGYRVILVMPDNMSIERRKLISAYGAEIVLTKSADKMAGAIKKAQELSLEIPNAFIPSQFTNVSNPKAHMLTTGPEIWEDMEGKIDAFIAGIGTGGTITGTAQFLKAIDSDIFVAGIEPASSPVLSGGEAGPHKIQGIGAGFVPEVLNRDIIDEIIKVENDEAYEMVREVAKTDGLLLGISSGAALWGAKTYLEKFPNKRVVAILPDTGERYLSMDIWE